MSQQSKGLYFVVKKTTKFSKDGVPTTNAFQDINSYYTKHRKQCEQAARPNSSFCGIHRSYKSDQANVVHDVFATQHNKDAYVKNIMKPQL